MSLLLPKDQRCHDRHLLLLQMLLKPSDTEGMYRLIRDLCTSSEIEEFSLRLHIATLLQEGVSYKEIEQKTCASSTTIARVSKYLKGDIGGYELVLK